MGIDQQDEANRALAAYQIANQQFKLGHFPQAITSYSGAIELQPNFAPAYHGRGTVHLALRDFEMALRDANQAIKIAPDYALAYYLYGAVSYAIGNIEEAKTNLNLAADLFQSNGKQADYQRVTGLLQQIRAMK
jgi:tetratricopeptide (TPR) repeat protein